MTMHGRFIETTILSASKHFVAEFIVKSEFRAVAATGEVPADNADL